MNITVKTSSYNYKGITDGIYIRIMSFMQKMVFQEVDPFLIDNIIYSQEI